jgi:probable phosphoglycerate mutase
VTRLVLIRHGQAQAFVDRVVAGHGCTGLSEHGREQAQRLRDRLVHTGELRDASVLYASLMRRAQETAEIIAPGVGDRTLEIRHDCGLCEQHPGDADGILFDEYVERYGDIDTLNQPDRAFVGPLGSESIDVMVDRISTALRRLTDEHAGETIVVACHGGVVGSSFEALAGIRMGSLVSHVENTSITEWTHGRHGWRLERSNDWGHLQ